MIDGNNGLPDVRAMAVFTDIRGLNVHRAFAGSVYTVVAVHTATCDVNVIEIGRCPGDCGMTVIAVIAARNMRRALAGCSDAVMAGAATTQNLCVVDSHHRRKHIRGVAIFADICRLNVCRVFASRLRAVMAADAVTKDVHVIEIRRRPADRAVTVFAGVAACNVCRVFAGCTNAIMAPNAVAEDTGMIKPGREPACRVVTVVALISG